MYFPTITKPTRVTDASATLIDHMWINRINYYSSGILYTNISDHFPIFSSFSVPAVSLYCEKITIHKRIFSNENSDFFATDLRNYNWKTTLTDINAIFATCMITFSNLYNKHFPIIEHTIKEKHMNKPYITQGIKNAIKTRKRLQKFYAKWPITYERTFKNYRNTLTALIRRTKSEYYKSKLSENAGNTKKIWEVANDIMGKNIHQLPELMIFEDKTTSNK